MCAVDFKATFFGLDRPLPSLSRVSLVFLLVLWLWVENARMGMSDTNTHAGSRLERPSVGAVVHVHKYTQIHTYAFMYAPTHKHARTFAGTHALPPPLPTHKRSRAHTHAHVRTRAHACIHTHARINTHARTHARTHPPVDHGRPSP